MLTIFYFKAHKNTKLFITHGGLGGVLEALHYAVPMIGIPLFSDQFRNVAAFVDKGMMVEVDYKNFNGKSLDKALNAVLHDSSFK